MTELDATKIPSARVVPFDALPAVARARLLRFLRGEGPTAPVLAQPHTPLWLAALMVPVMLLLAWLGSSALARLTGFGSGLVGAALLLLALGWAGSIPLRFLWQRALSTVRPGLYLFGAGVVEARADGRFVLVPHTEVQAVRVVERSRSARGRVLRAYAVDFAVGSALVSVDFGREPAARKASARYYEQFEALTRALAASDWAQVSSLDPLYELREPALWNALGVARPENTEPGERYRGSPRVLTHGYAVGGLLALLAIPWAVYSNAERADDGAYFRARSGSDRERTAGLERYIARGYTRHREEAQRELTELRARRAAANSGASGALTDEEFARAQLRMREAFGASARLLAWADPVLLALRTRATRAIAFRVVRPDRGALVALDGEIAAMVAQQSPVLRSVRASDELTGGQASAVEEAGDRVASRALAMLRNGLREGAVTLVREGPFAPGREPPVVVPTVEMRWSFAPRRCAFHRRSGRAFCRLRTSVTMALRDTSGAPVEFATSSEVEARSDGDFAGTRDVGAVLRYDAERQLVAALPAVEGWFTGR